MVGSRPLLVLLGIAVLGAVAWFVWQPKLVEAVPASPTSPAVVATPAASPPQLVNAPLPLPTPESAGVPVEQCIAYPDGTRLPPLNGVQKAPPMVFHKWTPFAKVIGRERDARGVEWYVHENGMRTTTRLQAKNGVMEPVAEVSMPAAAQPVVDDK
jgi:hypothetical protein